MTIQNYFEHFDKTFGTSISSNTDIDEFPMLKMAFDGLGEFVYNPSEDKKEITKTLLKIQKELTQTFNEEQKVLFEEYEETENMSVTELARQMIVFGYSVAYEQLKEMKALK